MRHFLNFCLYFALNFLQTAAIQFQIALNHPSDLLNRTQSLQLLLLKLPNHIQHLHLLHRIFLLSLPLQFGLSLLLSLLHGLCFHRLETLLFEDCLVLEDLRVCLFVLVLFDFGGELLCQFRGDFDVLLSFELIGQFGNLQFFMLVLRGHLLSPLPDSAQLSRKFSIPRLKT